MTTKVSADKRVMVCPRPELPPPPETLTTPWGPRKVLLLLACFGPAAIASSVSVGAGETIVVAGTGAWAEYRLLWLILLAVIVKGVVVTYLIGRYTALTGEPFGARLLRLPGPRGWALLAILLIELSVAGPVYAVIARPCGNLIEFALRPYLPAVVDHGTWQCTFATGFLLLALALAARSTYSAIERQQVIICCILVGGTLIGTLLVRPDPVRILAGLVPQLPLAEPWGPRHLQQYSLAYFLELVTIFGYVGNTVMGYVVYPNWVTLHGWGVTGARNIEALRSYAQITGRYDYLPAAPREARNVLERLLPLKWDVGMGAIVLGVVSAAFTIAGAAVLYPRQQLIAPQDMLTEQRYVWANISRWLVPVYYVTVIAALWGTLNALPEVWSRVAHEFLGELLPRKKPGFERVRRGVLLLICLPALTLLWTGVELRTLMGVTAFTTCSLGVALVGIAAYWFNIQLPPLYRPSRLLQCAGALSSVILLVATVGGGLSLIQHFLGP